ncbi:MAG: hypothetical protein IJT65_01980 [Eubacterium sp.]|nr:hypothetical protein [Eubacterium sp.]
MDETREIDIDLRKILFMMRNKVIYIILATFFVGAIAGLYTHFFIAPTYTATISMVVYNNPDRVSASQGVSQDDISAQTNLVGTYMFMLKSDKVLDKVAQELNLGSGSQIKGLISTSQEEGTFVFTTTVSHTDPEKAAKIANAIAKIAPDEMAKTTRAGEINVIDTAKTPSSPSAPNIKKNILIGALVGFLVSFAGFFVYEIFDTTITNSNDLEREFEFPVLGTVPTLEVVEREADNSDNELPPPSSNNDTLARPSSALLENIQSMKEGAKND